MYLNLLGLCCSRKSLCFGFSLLWQSANGTFHKAKSAFRIGRDNEAAKGVDAMKKDLDWKGLGRFLSMLVSLFAVIRDAFTSQGIGLEIVGWITGDGKEVFIKHFLTPLGEAFLAAQCVIVVDESTIRVNLDASPNLPFDGAIVDTNKGGGWVMVQKRSDGLYVDGRKIILYRSEHQKDGKAIRGYELRYELRNELTNAEVLHPNILDALCEHVHLIPEDWKQDENGNTILIYFWAVTYRGSDGGLCVRCLVWGGGAWLRGYDWLDYDFRGLGSAAVLASN